MNKHNINLHQSNGVYFTEYESHYSCYFSPQTLSPKVSTWLRACADSMETTTTQETQLTTRELSSATTTTTLDQLCPDILSEIFKFVSRSALSSISLVSKLFLSSISYRLFLSKHTISSLCELVGSCSKSNTNDKQFTQQDHFNIKLINIKEAEDIQNLINFIGNSRNEPILKRIEAISFDTFFQKQQENILALLNCLTAKANALPMLSSLSFDSIYCTSFELPSLPISITFLSFKEIYAKFTFLDLPANLISLSFQSIQNELIFTNPSLPITLRSLHLGMVQHHTFTLPELPASLTSFSYKVSIRSSLIDDEALEEQLEAIKAEVDARNQAQIDDQV